MLKLVKQRQANASRYRELITQIEFIEAMSEDQWWQVWMTTLADTQPWLPKLLWLEHLKDLALAESQLLLGGMGNAA